MSLNPAIINCNLLINSNIIFFFYYRNGPEYHPIIVCGDFNLQPFTGVYKFITEGSFDYIGKGRSLDENGFRRLSNSLIPSSLLITDNCQHFNVLTKRLRGYGDEKIMVIFLLLLI